MDLGPIGGNGVDGGGGKHQFPDTNHRKSGTAEGNLEVIYLKGEGIAGSGGNPVVTYPHRKKRGHGVIVGGSAANIQVMCKGYTP